MSLPIDGPRKPVEGTPCNGCGICCLATPCGAALKEVPGAVLGMTCPALEWDAGRAWCGMVRRPAFYLTPEAYLKLSGDEVETINQLVGKIWRRGLGDGSCDSGPDPDFGEEDDILGMTGHAYVEAGRP